MTADTAAPVSPERETLTRFMAASSKGHLTAAVVAILEYAGLPHAQEEERPPMWPYPEDLWAWVVARAEVERMIICQQMLGAARTVIVAESK